MARNWVPLRSISFIYTLCAVCCCWLVSVVVVSVDENAFAFVGFLSLSRCSQVFYSFVRFFPFYANSLRFAKWQKLFTRRTYIKSFQKMLSLSRWATHVCVLCSFLAHLTHIPAVYNAIEKLKKNLKLYSSQKRKIYFPFVIVRSFSVEIQKHNELSHLIRRKNRRRKGEFERARDLSCRNTFHFAVSLFSNI